jgi:UDP-N-acetylglucosamine 4,6-dehydratase (inverting)
MLSYFKNKTVLITGGTGSLGTALINFFIIKKFPLKKLIVLSRDELKQHDLFNKIGPKYNKLLRFFIGDVRDLQRLKSAFSGVDIVIHAAALKQVPAAEYNPTEFIKTNILGTQNVIEACLETSVKKALLLSTDKASSPINLYGATKLCADKLFISANNIKGKKDICFSVLRYGNVMGSRGSVIEVFREQLEKFGKVYLTDPKMTRFNILLEEAIELVLWSIINSRGGELIVPKLPSFYIKDLASLIGKNKYEISGIRVGEKLHEEMISDHDSPNTFDLGNKYAIVPANLKNFYKKKKIKLVPGGFSYNSRTNTNFLSKNNLNIILKKLNFF